MRWSSPSGPERGRPFRVWIIFALLLGATTLPIVSTALPPLFDYPNHLARMHLLATGGNQFYEVRWAALPNLAEDLVVPPLGRVMPLAIAAKLFLVATFALLAAGTIWLNRTATGSWRVWPLAAFSLLYSRTFLWGFLNYLFGIGCALCGVALWLALEKRRPSLRVLASAAVALVCFFSHLAAFGVYGLAILGVETPPALFELRERRWAALLRRSAIAAAQFVLPVAIFVAASPRPASSPVSYAGFWRKADLLFSVFDNYDRAFDIVCFALFLGLIGGLAMRRRLGLDVRLGCAVFLVFFAYLALPSQLLLGSGGDHRLPVAGFLLLLAASVPRFPDRRATIAVGATAGLLLAARLAIIERVWQQADRVYSADLAGIDALPRSAKLAVAFPSDAVHFVGVPELHLATLAISRRDAFVPTLFGVPAQQPIELRPPYDGLAVAAQPSLLWSAFVTSDPAARNAGLRALAAYDYVVFTDRHSFGVPPNDCLGPVFRQPTFQIFAVAHMRGCAAVDP